MSVPLWAAELAAAFWNQAGETEPFPRTLRRPIARALPLTIAWLPKLSIRAALSWLEKCGIVCEIPGADRPLRACLIARRGHGVALIDGSDGEAEKSFSLAHELAHFLREYWSLRRQVLKRLGSAALEVLDGQRCPTSQEQVHALLRNVSLEFHLHLMERDDEGEATTRAVEEAEEDADRLAYELLAPAEHVLRRRPRSRRVLGEELQKLYGLPELQATRYARILLPSAYSDPLLLRFKSRA